MEVDPVESDVEPMEVDLPPEEEEPMEVDPPPSGLGVHYQSMLARRRRWLRQRRSWRSRLSSRR